MQIKGVDASRLVMNDDLFNTSPQLAEQSVQSVQSEAPVPSTTAPLASAPMPAPEESVVNESTLAPTDRSLLDIVAPTVTDSSSTSQWSALISELSEAPTQNFRELGESNFASVLNELGIVKEVILTFDNDSTRLGSTNKALVQELVNLFDSESDVFSVIGCSNGRTNLAAGQRGLALGRAERVSEELLYAGVPQEKILEEGCWSGESFDARMPRRGVVLTLKREMG